MEQRNILIKEAFDFLYLHEKDLSSGQIDFIQGLKRYFTRNKTLSEKQCQALFEIREYLKVPDQVRFSSAINNK